MLLTKLSFAPVLVVLCAALSGCGSDDSKSSGGGDKFTGTWNVTGGSVILGGDCGNQTTALTGTVVFTKGSTSDLIATIEDCPLKFDVRGNSASALSGQTCTVSDSGVTGTLTYQSVVVTSTDGKVATISGNGVISATVAGTAVTCTETVSGNLQKL